MIRRVVFVIGTAALVAGCGGAAAPPKASEPSSAREPEPATVEEAQAQIAHAHAELGGAEAKTESTASECASSCRAIASMRRAVGALCRMTGDQDTRCVEAKRTLQESEARVSACGCGP
jgi:hypothetical protein